MMRGFRMKNGSVARDSSAVRRTDDNQLVRKTLAPENSECSVDTSIQPFVDTRDPATPRSGARRTLMSVLSCSRTNDPLVRPAAFDFSIRLLFASAALNRLTSFQHLRHFHRVAR